MTALVIIPTYNERDNIATLVEALLQHEGVGVLVVDDQSPDGTGQVAESLKQRHVGRVDVLHRTTHRGFGRSYVDGIKHALAGPAELICQMDADLSHDPARLPDLLAAAQHADVVIGSRYVPGGAIVNWPARRLLGLWILLAVLAFFQAILAASGYKHWGLGMFHPVNALLLLGLSGHLARYAWKSRTSTEEAAAPAAAASG